MKRPVRSRTILSSPQSIGPHNHGTIINKSRLSSSTTPTYLSTVTSRRGAVFFLFFLFLLLLSVYPEEFLKREEALKNSLTFRFLKPRPTISYKLIRGYQRNNTFDPYYICKADKYFGPRAAISQVFLQKGVLDFDTQLTTSLKIIVLGDSVGIQFSQALQEAAGAQMQNRHVIKYSWRNHEGVHLAQPVRGGGAVAGYRITGMFTYKQKDNHFQLAPVPGGGWMQEHVNLLTDAMMRGDDGISSGVSNSTDFDVMIMQFPYGWLERPKEQLFTHEILLEAIQTSHRVFGTQTVILQTVPVQNNVENLHRELLTVNNAIANFVHSYVPPRDGSGVQCILLMDLAFLSLNLFVHNAVGLKMVPASALDVLQKPISFREKERELVTYLNSTLDKRLNCCHPEYKEIVAFSCAEPVPDPNRTKYCQRNIYTNDGMHWCMNSTSGRMHGAIGCLLRCRYEYEYQGQALRDCEQKCNGIYMTLQPIDFQEGYELVNY